MNRTVTYAVIGGGVAGNYAAWRLARANRPDVHLFEKSLISGGRLLTAEVPGMPFRAELGGMRYTDRHIFVKHVIQELKLPTKPFEFNRKLMYLRGTHCTAGETSSYQLGVGETGKSCDLLMKHGIKSALSEVNFEQGKGELLALGELALIEEIRQIEEELRKLRAGEPLTIKLLTPRQWEILKRFGSLHNAWLYDLGFWNLLQHYLSSEGFLSVHDGLGYESIIANWNAAEAIEWFLRDFDVPYHTIETGMQTIPTALQYEFTEMRPECWHALHQLVAIERLDQRTADGTSRLRLHFKRYVEDEGTSPDEWDFEEEMFDADYVILALPADAVREIVFRNLDGREFRRSSWEAPALPNELQGLRFVTAQRLFKLFLGYDRAWWHDLRGIGSRSGISITDLPIRQVYYWGSDKAYETTQKGMLMASYSDSHYVDFWTPLHRRKGKEPYCDARLRESLSESQREVLSAWGVTENMVMKAHRQVKKLHPELSQSDSIPDPVIALAKEWPNGWHTWNVHAKPWEVSQQLVRPFGETALYIAGESLSREQGWVEGALRSTERVLHSMEIGDPGIDFSEFYDQKFRGYEEYIGVFDLGRSPGGADAQA